MYNGAASVADKLMTDRISDKLECTCGKVFNITITVSDGHHHNGQPASNEDNVYMKRGRKSIPPRKLVRSNHSLAISPPVVAESPPAAIVTAPALPHTPLQQSTTTAAGAACLHPLNFARILDPVRYGECCRTLFQSVGSFAFGSLNGAVHGVHSNSDHGSPSPNTSIPDIMDAPRRENINNLLLALGSTATDVRTNFFNVLAVNPTQSIQCPSITTLPQTQNLQPPPPPPPPTFTPHTSTGTTRSVIQVEAIESRENISKNKKLTKFGLLKLSEGESDKNCSTLTNHSLNQSQIPNDSGKNAHVEEVIDGKKRFKCPSCSNIYANRSGLNRHYVTHSVNDEWKSKCAICGKKYSRKDSLKHHIKTQHHMNNDEAGRVISRSDKKLIAAAAAKQGIYYDTSSTAASSAILYDTGAESPKRRRLESFSDIDMNDPICQTVVQLVGEMEGAIVKAFGDFNTDSTQ
ncbi:hypothetical protein ACOME3_008464 [Neoechinorhynchus agilis]